jgi:hypothetical protein
MRQLAFLLLALSLVTTQTVVFALTKVNVHITNQSGGPIAVNWVDRTTRDLTLMFNIMSEDETGLNTYYGDEFEVRELPNESGECGSDADTSCKAVNFEITERSEQCKYFLCSVVFCCRSKLT